MSARVQIYLKKPNCNSVAQFGECIVDFFGFVNEGHVGLIQGENSITLFHLENDDDPKAVLLRHAVECPVHVLANKTDYPSDLRQKGVGLGVAVLLTSSDNHVLITRRANHMRTFPGVWVPPGGHVETGESLINAARRELYEETGLAPENDSHDLLGLWESVYPHKIEFGEPLRQHIVAYYALKSKLTSSQLTDLVKLDPNETDAAMWLPLAFVERFATGVSIEELPSHLSVIHQVDGRTCKLQVEALPIAEQMSPPAGSTELDLERLTWGTRFALRQWNRWIKQESRYCKL